MHKVGTAWFIRSRLPFSHKSVAGQIDATLARRITEAEDVQTLWYLRADLVGASASCHGEAQAMETLRSISSRFQGRLSRRLSTRRSPLAHC